jgi:hypothetical protein
MYTAKTSGARTNTVMNSSAGLTSATPVAGGWVSER